MKTISVKWPLFHGEVSNYILVDGFTESKRVKRRQNRPRFVYTHFKSSDQSIDKTSFAVSNIFRAMRSCVMSAKSRIILKLPKIMVA